MKLYFARHGQTNYNVLDLCNADPSKVPIETAQLLMSAMEAAHNRWAARFNDGESIEDMKQRVAVFLDELKRKPYKNVLIITSGWIIHAAAAIIQNISNEDAWKIDFSQGSYLEVDIQQKDHSQGLSLCLCLAGHKGRL